MGTTNRLGLERFGGTLGGQLSDKGYKFSNGDRAILDAFLSALEGHTHAGGTRLVDPVGAPAVVLNTTAGNIPAGATLYYRVSFMDAYGLESAASVEVEVATPFPLDRPSPPALSSSAVGTLTPGQYQYAVSLLTADGSETTPSAASTISLNSGMTSVALTLPAVPVGATAYRLYRKSPAESQLFYLTQTSALTYTDSGGVTDATRTPSLTNTTNSKNSVVVTMPDLDGGGLPPVGVASWRIYRATGSADYGDAALVHDVVEHISEVDPTTPLLVDWTDAGAPLSSGLPLDISTTFDPPTPVAAGDQSYTANPAAASTATNVSEALGELYARSVARVRVAVGVTALASSAVVELRYAGAAVPFVVDGELVGYRLQEVTARASAVITAGTVTLAVMLNGVAVVGASVVLASGTQQASLVLPTRSSLNAGDRVTVRATTSAGLAPAVDVAATVVVRAL